MDSNDKPPYRHWHVVCAACSKVTLARPCNVPGEVKPVEHNPVIRCQHCGETRQHLDSACFLTPLSKRRHLTSQPVPSRWWPGWSQQ